MGSETVTLLSRWHTGDRKALDELIVRHLSWIRSHVSRRLGPELRRRAETGDVVQDVLIEVLSYCPRFRVSSTEEFRALMGRIIENSLRDSHDWFSARRRDMARDRPLPSDTVLELDPVRGRLQETPSQVVLRDEQEAFVRLGLELLDCSDRDLIVLRQWDDLSFSEIAKALEISVEAAHKRYARAVQRLARTVDAMRESDVPRALGLASKERQPEWDLHVDGK